MAFWTTFEWYIQKNKVLLTLAQHHSFDVIIKDTYSTAAAAYCIQTSFFPFSMTALTFVVWGLRYTYLPTPKGRSAKKFGHSNLSLFYRLVYLEHKSFQYLPFILQFLLLRKWEGSIAKWLKTKREILRQKIYLQVMNRSPREDL